MWFPGGIVRDLAVELVKQRRVCARALGQKLMPALPAGLERVSLPA